MLKILVLGGSGLIGNKILKKFKNLKINNISVAIEGKKPKLESYVDRIKESLAGLCGVKKEDVGLTLTSGEELTDFGKGLGLQAFSVVSLRRQ